jgi:hypothetical protein
MPTTCYHERPGNFIVEVFFGRSAGFARFVTLALAGVFVFLLFFGIEDLECIRLDVFDWG